VKELDSLQSKVNQLLVIFFYPEAAKFYRKSYWNKSDSEIRGRVAESRAFFNKLDYNSLLEKCNFLSVHERLYYYYGWTVYEFRKYGCKVKELEDMFAAEPISDTVDMVTTRSSTNRLSVLVHSTYLFENAVRYACCKIWNALPSEIRNYEDTKVIVHKHLCEWLINERDDIYTT
jgi:hypothetical protein